ncbi:MAG: hypothetical protein IT336_12500 [Thermomicrobiales bacterium]|nr:hypothetical protein [Thermomicrobiales bacterium]
MSDAPAREIERPRWAERLGRIGRSLDETGQDMRDLAIVLDGGPDDLGASISLLGHRQSIFHSGWASLLYRIDPSSDVIVNHATGHSEATYQPTVRPSSAVGPWSRKLQAVGALIDELHPDLRSPTLIELPGGMVVNGIALGAIGDPSGSLLSFELSNQQIEDVAAAAAHSGQSATLSARSA